MFAKFHFPAEFFKSPQLATTIPSAHFLEPRTSKDVVLGKRRGGDNIGDYKVHHSNEVEGRLSHNSKPNTTLKVSFFKPLQTIHNSSLLAKEYL